MHGRDAFEQLWALGYRRLCPVIPPGAPISPRSSLFKRLAKGDDARGKMPGVRWADGTWSGYDFVAHESAEADLARWHAMGAGVGIKTGQGLALIDADASDPATAALIAATLREHFGDLPARIGRAPKAGYLVRIEGEFQYARVEFGQRDAKGRLRDRVEILYEGRQFVAHGIHPATGQPYRWPDGVPALESVPIVPAAALVAFLAALRPLLPSASEVVREGAPTEIDQNALRGDVELVRKAVAATPNTSDLFPTRESYLHYGFAIKAALPDDEPEALHLFQDWCARWEDGTNEPDIVAGDWRRMKPPFRRGASWLYQLAEQHGDGQFNTADRWLEPHDEPLFPPDPQFGLATADADGGRRNDSARARLAWTTFNDAADGALTDSAAPLIKGLLDQGAMTVLYGESNVGKTFVAMDIAHHVAMGSDWGRMRTTQAAVTYVAAEGGRGARKRAAALRTRFGDPGDAFRFLLSPVDLLRPNADLRLLVEMLQALPSPPGLIVVDTFSRAMAGGDENSSTDMGAMVKHMDVLRNATGAHLLVVHHSGKDASKGARGHSLLRAATDTEIEIKDGRIAVTKQRDLDRSWSSAFTLETVDLGRDPDGDAVTSCVLRLVDAAEGATLPQLQLDAIREEVEGRDWGTRDSGRGSDAVEWVGVPLAAALVLDLRKPGDKRRVKEIEERLLRTHPA